MTISPLVSLSRRTIVALALMFVVFAGWALICFAYPNAPGPITFNVVSKILACVAGLTLFLRAQAWSTLREVVTNERAHGLT